MYHYLDDKKFVKKIQSESSKLMQEFCHILKTDYDIGTNFYLVGSGAKNLIMQNESVPIDLDYNLEILRCKKINDCRYIKECTRKAFNKVLNKRGLGNCQDSTSSLTTKRFQLPTGNPTEFSIDVCIVKSDKSGNLFRLIHEKTGCTYFDQYHWNIAPNSNKIKNKVEYIKSNRKWELVRSEYKNIKNKYLRCNDRNHPSFVCYLEAINNVYNQLNMPMNNSGWRSIWS